MTETAIHKTRGEEVFLNVDKSHMEAYVAHPSKGFGPHPAVLVLMEIFGVNSHIRSVCDRLAQEGYVAMAYNYYHRTTPNIELDYNEAGIEIGRRHKSHVSREGFITDTRAAMKYLASRADIQPKDCLGVIGFCFGGHLAYLVSSLPEISATAAFYGGGIASAPLAGTDKLTLEVTPEIRGEILCFFGEKDPLIPASDVSAVQSSLESARVNHRVITYPNAGHGFFCEQRPDFVPDVAEDAWQRTLALFNRNLKPHGRISDSGYEI